MKKQREDVDYKFDYRQSRKTPKLPYEEDEDEDEDEDAGFNDQDGGRTLGERMP